MFFLGTAHASRSDRIEVDQGGEVADFVVRRGFPGSALDAIRRSCQQVTFDRV